MPKILTIFALAAATVLGANCMIGGEEKQPEDDRLEKWLLEVEARLMKLEEEEEEEPAPLRVEGGVDAEIVEYLLALEVQTDFSPIFETNEAGSVIDVGVGVAPEEDLALGEILQRIEPLRSVESAEIYELANATLKEPFVDIDLLNLLEWKELKKLKITVRKINGEAMVELTRHNRLLNLEELSYGSVKEQADLVLASIAHCEKLREIDLCSSDLTDEGVRHLSELTKLEDLDFNYTSVTGIGFANAKYASTLRDLSLEECPITNEGLEAISNFRNLKKLYTGENSELVTDEGIFHLSKLKQLQSLSITGATITHKGVAAISGLTKVKSLWLEHTPIDDQSIPYLVRMKNLENLWIRNTNISEKGLRRLKRSLPNCDFIY